MRRVLYFVSGHGFGHSVRSALIIGELHRLGIGSEIITASPKFIFDCNLRGVEFGFHEDVSDVGVSQVSGIEMDLPDTMEKWKKYLNGEKEWTQKWLEVCRKLKPDAIVADIVPLALPLARKASLPSILVATFTWDWILDFYKDDHPEFSKISQDIAPCYLMADELIYSPLSYGLPEIKNRHLVSLIAKKSRLSKNEIRNKLRLDERDSFLISFGGTGLNDYTRLQLDKMTDYQFLLLSGESRRDGNIISFTNNEVNHEDLVAVSRAVVTKPGYGISCETILSNTPMIYTSRGKFAEYEPLAADIKRYIPAKFISNEQLFSGGLNDYLKNPPRFEQEYLNDTGEGAIEAARIIAKSIS